jgi:acyl carrier protein
MTPLQATLVEIALGVNGRAVLKDDADLRRKFSEIGIDSLEVMSLMLAVMERYKIDIPDAEVENLANLSQLAEFVERELSNLGRKP